MNEETIVPGRQSLVIVLAKLWQCNYPEAWARERALSPDLQGQLGIVLNQMVSNLSEEEEILIGEVLGQELNGNDPNWTPIIQPFQQRTDYLEVMSRIETFEAQMLAATAATSA